MIIHHPAKANTDIGTISDIKQMWDYIRMHLKITDIKDSIKAGHYFDLWRLFFRVSGLSYLSYSPDLFIMNGSVLPVLLLIIV